jgi:hypothetical protein
MHRCLNRLNGKTPREKPGGELIMILTTLAEYQTSLRQAVLTSLRLI